MAKKEVNEKVVPIKLTDTETGETYELEFDKGSVYFAEARGFDIEDVSRAPMTGIHDLFFYAFRKNHPKVSRQKTDKILDEGIGGVGALPEGFLERLYLLYNAPFEDLKENDGKNRTVQIEL